MSAFADMVVVPRPRHVVESGRGAPVGTPITSAVDTDRPPQGFRITVTPDAVHVDHRDDLGLRYAHQLLDQVAAQTTDGRYPSMQVEDHPDVLQRGLMLDISRDRVPTRATLERIVELCSLARITQLQLYMEHTFTYRHHRDVWAAASPMTPAHLTWLDDLCAQRGIELVANQNCFGHMGRWLTLPAYRDRAECPDGWELLPGVPMPPSVLAPTEDNATFALGLLAELLPSFRSRQVNIGCDEPFELGRGASAAAVAELGRGEVYVDHVARIAGPLTEDGYTVQVWADVLRQHPELAARLPAGTIPVAWCYEAAPEDGRPPDVPPAVASVLEALGTDVGAFSGFAAQVAPLVEADVPFWVAGGTSGWNSLVGRIDNARANLLDAAETARAHDCGGLLITDWGDGGHHQPPSVSFGPIVYGGAVAWGVDANRDLDLSTVLDHHVFIDPSGTLSSALDRMGRVWRQTGRTAVNGSPLSAALFPDAPHLVFGRPDPDLVGAVVDVLDGAITDLATATAGAPDGALTVRELGHAARMARHGAYRLMGDEAPGTGLMAEDMAELVEGQVACWLDRSRPGGLFDSLARLDGSLALEIAVPDPEADDLP